MRNVVALVHSPSEGSGIGELAIRLGDLGLTVSHEDWSFEPTESLVKRLRGAGHPVTGLVVLGHATTCLWFQEAADSGFLRYLDQRGIRLVRLELPRLSSSRELPWLPAFSSDSAKVVRLAEALLPETELIAELQRLQARSEETLRAIRSAPFTQDWSTLQRDLDLLLQSAVEVRCQMEIRSLVLEGPEPGGTLWVAGFAALTREPMDLPPGSWSWLKEVGRRLIHDTRTDLATLPLLVERARREGVQEVTGFETVLERLETVFGHFWILRDPP